MQSIIEKMYGGKLDVMTAMDAQQNLERRVMRFDPDKDTNIEANNLAVRNAMSSAMHDRCSLQGRTPPDHSSTAASTASSSAEPALALNLQAGKALSTFDSLSWVYSFVEFFYGDCVPRHPSRDGGVYVPMSFEQVFQCLLLREEAEYKLPTDSATHPYRARPMSRWDNPTMVMVFASTLRSLHMLRASRCSIFLGPQADTFFEDMKAIAESSVEDFERVLSFDMHKGAQTLIQALQSPKLAETNKAVYTALKHTLLQTSTVPLTEGNKMKM